ncbi:hypothetical protein BDB01DRAFT_436303 [Pilobolus umbonatus]|nr:hypothetical protein BDB01DRAFT_436303 [Pilobolus umbonatus]
MDKKRSTRLDNLKTLTPPTSAFDSATTLSSLSLEDSSRRLNDITSNPEQLGFFQSYLIGIDAQKYLLFIEALNELRHENDLYKIEHVVDR